MKRQLANRLFLAQAAVLVAGLGVLLFTAHRLLGTYLQESQLANIPATTMSRAEQFGTILRYKELILQRLATDEAVDRFLYSGNPRDIEPLLQGFIPEFSAIVLLDEEGRPRFGPLPADATPPLPDADLVQRILWQPNRPVAVLLPGGQGAMFLYYLEQFGEFGAIFLAMLPDSKLVEIFGGMRYGTNGFFLVTDSRGTTLLADPALPTGPIPGSIPPFWLTEGPEGRLLPINGQPCYLAASPVPGGDWWLVGVLPEEETFLLSRRLLGRMALVAGLVLAAWAAVTALLAPDGRQDETSGPATPRTSTP